MTRRSRFFWARTRAASGALVALGTIAALATLIVGLFIALTAGVLSDLSNPGLGPTIMALGVVAVLAAVVVAAASVEPVRQRLDERALLRARGMSKAQLVRLTLGETVPVLVLGGLLGAGLALVLALVLSDGSQALWPVFLVVIVLTIVGSLAATIAVLRGVDRRWARGDLLAGISALVLLGAVTGIAAWQFARTGTPIISLGNGRKAVDPLIALAPALGLALFALVAIVVLRPIAGLMARPAARSLGILPSLPVRLAGRRLGRHALTTGVVAFAAATLALAVTYQGSLTALGETPEQLRVGAPVRVISITDDAERKQIADFGGVEAAMQAGVVAIRSASGTYPLLAVDASQLGATMFDVDGEIDPADLGQTLAVAPWGIPIAAGAQTLSVEARATSAEHTPLIGVTIAIVDSVGSLQQVEVVNMEPSAIAESEQTQSWSAHDALPTVTREFELSGIGPWRIVSLDADQFMPWLRAPGAQLALSVQASGAAVDLADLASENSTPTATGVVIGLDDSVHFEAPGAPQRVPLVVSEEIARTLNVEVGSPLSIASTTPPFTLDGEVVRVVTFIPGLINGSGVMADLRALNAASHDPTLANELWLATATPADVVANINANISGVAVQSNDGARAQAASDSARAFVLAAIGAATLAVIVLLLRRSRTDGSERELGMLAVLGLGRKRAARVRAAEDVFAISVGAASGLAAGVAAAYLAVPTFIRSVYPGLSTEYSVGVTVPWLPLLGAILVLALVFALIAASVRVPRLLDRALREAE